MTLFTKLHKLQSGHGQVKHSCRLFWHALVVIAIAIHANTGIMSTH